MRVLVTGTAGFIGSAVASTLLERGDEVVGIDNLNDYYDVSLKKARLERIAVGARLAREPGDSAARSEGRSGFSRDQFHFEKKAF